MAYQVYYDKDYNTWAESQVINYMKKKGSEPVAIIGTAKGGANYFVLAYPDYGDERGVKFKKGEQLFRYASPATMLGGMLPLCKVNFKRGLIYYLTQDSFDGKIDNAEFETRGEKLTFARVLPGVFEESANELQSFAEFLVEEKSSKMKDDDDMEEEGEEEEDDEEDMEESTNDNVKVDTETVRKLMGDTKNKNDAVKKVMKHFGISQAYADKAVQYVIMADTK